MAFPVYFFTVMTVLAVFLSLFLTPGLGENVWCKSKQTTRHFKEMCIRTGACSSDMPIIYGTKLCQDPKSTLIFNTANGLRYDACEQGSDPCTVPANNDYHKIQVCFTTPDYPVDLWFTNLTFTVQLPTGPQNINDGYEQRFSLLANTVYTFQADFKVDFPTTGLASFTTTFKFVFYNTDKQPVLCVTGEAKSDGIVRKSKFIHSFDAISDA